ncbi:MAG: type II toxin-antitoxin system Phd/YefM family antitoxin [Anaerolineales bacterium]|nr:type II toxin-antitoxin system Phd/YefM family antitoxin [Anaerolineales bacterium]
MTQVNMLEAKTNLSRLVEAIEQEIERKIIARNGQAVAKLVPIEKPAVEQRIGVAKGKFVVPDDIDRSNEDIAELFFTGDKR